MPLMYFRKMRKNMGRKETILPGAKIDGRKYLEDKPNEFYFHTSSPLKSNG